jgi:putative tryptophan/tyrosine transport system substrate-binding protein
VQRLHELGWIEGRTVAIQYRWAEGRTERFAEIAAEFIRLKVDVIVTGGNAAVAAKQASSVIPIVIPLMDDPVGSGLVVSLARPGGNITGLSIQQTDLAGKRLALLREVVPGLRRLAIMANVNYPPAVREMDQIRAAANTLGLDVAIFEIRRAEDIEPAFKALRDANALFVVGDALTYTHRTQLIALVQDARLPAAYPVREFVLAGGLMSYGPNYSDMFRRAAEYVDKILRGAKPSDIPIEQPTKFDPFINLASAKAIGPSIPESFLVRVDEVIE